MRASVDECMRDKKGLIIGRLDVVVAAAAVVVVVAVVVVDVVAAVESLFHSGNFWNKGVSDD